MTRGERIRPSYRRPSVNAEVVVKGRHGDQDTRAKAHVTVSFYTNGEPSDVFLAVAKAGTDLRVAYSAWARMASKSLQRGVPMSDVADSIRGTRDDQGGQIVSPDELAGKPAGSLWDAIGQFLEVA